ncbi:MAG: hypothetical protein VXV96_09070 [Bdellovibrionota bacterium]|nr:hypothetical protein [Bdellovibrionota bacterium]
MEKKSTLPYLWLFLSGVIALSYEVLWIHYFRLLLGNTIYSFSWTSGVFLFGISFGTYLSTYFLKDKKRDLLKSYAFLELAIALLSLGSFTLLMATPQFILNFLNPHHLLKDGMIAFTFIFPITTLMGLSFPVLTEIFKENYVIEKLYGINTIGGGIGIFLLGFLSISQFGYRSTFWLTSFLNIALFLWVFLKRATFTRPQSEQSDHNESQVPFSLGAISFISGFTLLGLEVVWFRSLEIIINDRAYISTLVLFCVLCILGLTSWLTPKIFKKKLTPLYFLIPLSFLFFLIADFLAPQAFLVSRSYPRVSTVKTSYVILCFLLPLFTLGFTFPALLNFKKWNGVGTAKLLLLNTIGGMSGTLIVSYGIIDWLGMKSFYPISMLTMLVLIFLIPQKKFKSLAIGACATILTIFFLNFEPQVFIHKRDQVLFSDETPSGVFSLIRRNGKLEIYAGNYRIVATYDTENVTHTQNGLAYFPALYMVDTPEKILTMGTGYGISLGAFLTLNPKEIISVELHKSVNHVSPYFKEANRQWYDDPRVEKVIDDARGYLKRSRERYDLISSNITSPYTTGGSLFLTTQYYQEVAKRLKPGGLYSQLVWGPHLPEILHTFVKVFPYTKAIPGYDETDVIIIGSFEPLKMRKDIHTYDDQWPLYKGKYSREETFEIGEKIMEESLKRKPDFIVDDHYADLTHNWDRGLKFFWIYGP